MRSAGAEAGAAAEGGEARRAMDRLYALYLLVAGVALAFPGRPRVWPVLALVHVLGAALALGIGPFGELERAVARRTPRVARVIHDWYPLATMPLLYTELATLNVAVWGGRFFDAVIQGIEQGVFGTQPSYALSRALPYLALSEVLHASYLSYYLIIYGPPLLLYFLGRRGDFRRLVFPLMLTFCVHYLFFVYFPVQGPRYLFPAPGECWRRAPSTGWRTSSWRRARAAAPPSRRRTWRCPRPRPFWSSGSCRDSGRWWPCSRWGWRSAPSTVVSITPPMQSPGSCWGWRWCWPRPRSSACSRPGAWPREGAGPKARR